MREPLQGATKVANCPSDPLVGELHGVENTDQGFDGSRPPAVRAAAVVPSRPVVPGVIPGLFDCCAARGGGGGDEETRTPDPLLAKEMLYQLSYVPLAVG